MERIVWPHAFQVLPKTLRSQDGMPKKPPAAKVISSLERRSWQPWAGSQDYKLLGFVWEHSVHEQRLEVNKEHAEMQQSCCLTTLSEVTGRKSDASALAKQASRVQ